MLFLMHSILAVTSSVLSAAESCRSVAQCETGSVLCVFLFHGLRYQILCWTPALLPLQLSAYTPRLSACPHKPVCLSLGPRLSLPRPLLLVCFYSSTTSMSPSVCLLSFFVFHLSVISSQPVFLSASDLLLAPGRRRQQR